MRIPRGPSGTGTRWAPSSRWPRRPMGICGWAANSASFASTVFALSLATTFGSATPRQALQSACHARRHTLDRHLCRPCKLEWCRVDPVPGGWQRVCDIAARRPRGNSVGRHTGEPGPAVRNPKRPRAMLRGGWRVSAHSFGVWVRTAQALSGPAQSLGFGDGSPALPSDMRCRDRGSVI